MKAIEFMDQFLKASAKIIVIDEDWNELYKGELKDCPHWTYSGRRLIKSYCSQYDKAIVIMVEKKVTK